MRARNLKPSLFKNELLGAANPLYTVIFAGLWCLADREGRLEDRPLRIHVEVNPYRDSASTVQALDWLVTNGFLIRYVVGNEKYLAVANFSKHQQPHIKEADSKIPAPTNQWVVEAPDKHCASTGVAALIPDSGFPLPDSGLLTADTDVRELSPGFNAWVQSEYPKTSHTRKWTDALHFAGVIVGSGRATEADLRRRVTGYRAFVDGRGVSDPSKVITPQNWFNPQGEDAGWSREWAAPPTKSQQTQDANIAASQKWLAQGNA